MKNRQDNINDYQSLYQNITEALKKPLIGTQTVGVTNKRKESKQTKKLRQDKNKLKRDLQSAIQRKDPEKTTNPEQNHIKQPESTARTTG